MYLKLTALFIFFMLIIGQFSIVHAETNESRLSQLFSQFQSIAALFSSISSFFINDTPSAQMALVGNVDGPVDDYTPPIGIPDPGDEWTIHPITGDTPARPQNWNGEVTDYYYIDPDHASSTNTGNTYGYPSRPRTSLPTSVAAGSYVEVHGTYSSSVTLGWQCTAAEPCWIVGDEDDMPVISGSITLSNAAHVFVEYINFTGGSGSAFGISGNSHHIVFRNSRITDRAQPGGNSTGINILPGSSQTIENVVIYNNYFADLGDWQITEDIDFHGVTPSMWGRDSTALLTKVWILNNYCTRLSGDCVQVNAGNWTNSWQYLNHIYIGENESYQNRQSGFWVKQASDVIISQNKSSGSDGNGGANAGSAAGMQYEKDNVWFIFNELHDSVFGIRQSDTSTGKTDGKIYIIGNLIYDIRPADLDAYDPTHNWQQGVGIALWHGNSERYIVDNTMHNVYEGITAIYSGVVDVKGNIISEKDDHTNNYFFDLNHPARNDLVTMDYNLFLDDNDESYYTWWGDANRVTSLSTIQSVSGGQCSNCNTIIGGSSPFVDADSADFHLVSSSIATSSNVKHPAYDAFEQRYGIDIYVDFDGESRSESSPSLGALEFASGEEEPEESPQTCTNFTYSSWGSCQSNSTQSRTVVSSTPSGCTGGSPVLTQSCTYTAPSSGGGGGGGGSSGGGGGGSSSSRNNDSDDDSQEEENDDEDSVDDENNEEETDSNTYTGIGNIVLLSRNLYLGTRGDDVKLLQNKLIDDGYLASDGNTGYYGAMTEAAVKAFQRAHNIISYGDAVSTGYGVMGPSTRDKFNALYGLTTTNANNSELDRTAALQAQIAALLKTIAELQALLAARRGETISNNTPGQILFTRNLWTTVTGTDVSLLQQKLATDPAIYPEGEITGYFGESTKRAVERFQCRYNIVCGGDALSTGYGAVGPSTRAKLNEVFGN